jgi:hypothetical protein
MSSRFDKIAEFIANRYTAAQELLKKNADSSAKQASVTGEDPLYPTFNLPLGLGAGGLSFLSNWESSDPASMLRNRPFEWINGTELGKQLTNPYEKFLHDLFRQQENVKGGPKIVGRILSQFAGKQNVGTPAYRSKLLKALQPLIDTSQGMKDQFDTLVKSPHPAFFKRMPVLADTWDDWASRTTSLPLGTKETFRNLADSLRRAKTIDEVRQIGLKLRNFAEKESKGKQGKPSGYNGHTFYEPDRTRMTRWSDALQKGKVPLFPAADKIDELGRGLGKFTNVPKKPILSRLGGASLRGGAATAAGGLVLPMLLDTFVPHPK